MKSWPQSQWHKLDGSLDKTGKNTPNSQEKGTGEICKLSKKSRPAKFWLFRVFGFFCRKGLMFTQLRSMGQKTCRKQRSKMKRRSTKTQKATRRKRRQKILRKNWTWWVLLSFHYTPCESQGMSCTENPATGKDLLPHTPGACQKKCCARLIPKMRGWVWCNSATSGTEHYLPKKDPFPRWNHCHHYFLTTCTARIRGRGRTTALSSRDSRAESISQL